MDILEVIAEEVDNLIDGLLLGLQVLVEPGGVHHGHLYTHKEHFTTNIR